MGRAEADPAARAEYNTRRQHSRSHSSSGQARAWCENRPPSRHPSQTGHHAGIDRCGTPCKDKNKETQMDHRCHVVGGHNKNRSARGTHLGLPRNTLPLSRQNTYNGLSTPVEQDGSRDFSEPTPSSNLEMQRQHRVQAEEAPSSRIPEAVSRDHLSGSSQQPGSRNAESLLNNSMQHSDVTRHQDGSQRKSSNSQRFDFWYSSSQDRRHRRSSGSSSSADFPPPDIDWETSEEQKSGVASKLPSKNQLVDAPDPYAFEKDLRSGQLSRLPSRDARSIGPSGSRRREDFKWHLSGKRGPSVQKGIYPALTASLLPSHALYGVAVLLLSEPKRKQRLTHPEANAPDRIASIHVS